MLNGGQHLYIGFMLLGFFFFLEMEALVLEKIVMTILSLRFSSPLGNTHTHVYIIYIYRYNRSLYIESHRSICQIMGVMPLHERHILRTWHEKMKRSSCIHQNIQNSETYTAACLMMSFHTQFPALFKISPEIYRYDCGCART